MRLNSPRHDHLYLNFFKSYNLKKSKESWHQYHLTAQNCYRIIQNCIFCWKYGIFPKNIAFSSCLSKISSERSICWRSFKHILSKAVTGGKLHKIAIYWYWFSDFATFNTTFLTRCWWFQWFLGVLNGLRILLILSFQFCHDVHRSTFLTHCWCFQWTFWLLKALCILNQFNDIDFPTVPRCSTQHV